MWIYNKDINKWEVKQGDLSKSSFDVYKQELSSTRFYSKCLSGATYLPVNDLNDIYETLKYEKNTNWFIPTSISQYSETSVPNDNATFIDKSGFYFEKVLNDCDLVMHVGIFKKELLDSEQELKSKLEDFYKVLGWDYPNENDAKASEFFGF